MTTSIGVAVPRVGGYARVTGRQTYVADIRLDDALEVKLVHLDCARARIRSIDTASAAALDGVRLVLTAADLSQPMPRFGPVHEDRPILAAGETTYFGQPVAAVAAESKAAAEAGAGMIRVEYDELPGVYTVAQALDPAAPLVQEPELRRGDPLSGTNVLREMHYGWGDVDAAQADVVIEHLYTFPMVTHFAIEPHGFLAAPDGDGIAVWTATQNPFQMQRILSAVLRLPLAKVRIIAPDPGGAFGGKQHPKYEPLVAMLALRTGRPVRLILTLEETFQEVRRTSCEIHARWGFTRDGRIVFADIESNFLMGAYADIAERVIAKSNYLACGPYRVPSARILVRAILSHTTPSTAFRGFGTPQVAWAHESQLDAAARQLGIDRVEIRLRNLARTGEAFVPHDTPADGDWAESVRKAAAALNWDTPLPDGHGRGLAVAIKASATTGASYAIVRLHCDASATVLAGTSDMGQGARTVLAQIAAQELGIPVDRVSVVMGDTAVVPFDLQTSASRSTVFMGQAVLRACQDIQRQLLQTAGNEARPAASEGGSTPLHDALLARFGEVRGEVIGVGSMRREQVPGHPLGGTASFYEFSVTASEVAVDRETGEVQVVRHVTVADAGKALNPQQVRGQDEGAAVMGLGHTLMEHVILDDRGRIRNLGALDYRIPTSKDLPLEMRSMVVENGDGPGPYGAKGAGEGGLMPTAPAIASAVAEATGVVIRDLPLTPERVWRAIQEQARRAGERP
ncbi:MAG TPA: xanthine dehydrogenase family protein molybdopterin-binding subunit [Candidatus Limnocylindrales bacterium]|nr:xanthine dehydrogenase family protein molybdopterin-binding subunit [Candidatus Limnocylindrales bacterium]